MDLVTRFEDLDNPGERGVVAKVKAAVQADGPGALVGLTFTSENRLTNDELVADGADVRWPFYSFAAGRIVRPLVTAARVTGHSLWSTARPAGGAAIRVELTLDLEDGHEPERLMGWVR